MTTLPGTRGLTEAKRALLERRLRGDAVETRVIPGRPAGQDVPLSPAQQAMWVVNKLLGDNAVYSVNRMLRLRGHLDRAALRRALDELVRRHEILRTTYRDAVPPSQLVHPAGPAALEVVDLGHLPAERRGEEATRLADATVARPFDLADGPLFRVLLVAVDPGEHLLVLNMHHLLSDEWSCGVLAGELSALYGAYASGARPSLPALPIQYADYACFQAGRISGEVLAGQLAYWRELLRETPRVLQLATDHPRPPAPSHRGHLVRRTLTPAASDAVRELAASHGVTVFTLLLTAFAAFLRCCTGQQRFAMGTLVSGRQWAETEPLLGLFTNIVAIPADVSGDPSFADLVRRMNGSVLSALDRQDVTFEQVVSELNVARDLSRNPVFQVLFQWVEASGHRWDLPGLSAEPVRAEREPAKVDLMLFAVNGAESIALEMVGEAALFEARTVERLLGDFVGLLERVMADPSASLAEAARDARVEVAAPPDPEPARADSGQPYVAPRTPTERALAEVWSRLLRVDRVGVHDNFFELGGDSILSIHTVAKAREAGLEVTARQVFAHQTVAGLAGDVDRAGAAAAAPPPRPDQDRVTGPVALTPIQQAFTELALPHDHYNLSVLLELEPAPDPALLARALAALVDHHDTLRLRLVRTGAGWQQLIAEREDAELLEVHDLEAVPAGERPARMRAAADQAQASLDLATGPIVCALLFRSPEPPDRLLLVAHHVAVDTVSWRILLEDLATAYQHLDAGAEVRLPPRTTSFQRWSHRLVEYATGSRFAAEAAAWRDRAADAAPLPVDRPGGDNTLARAATILSVLPAATTRSLLREVPAAYRTQINDVLLAALARTVCDWTGARAASVDLEGHGREPLFDDVDLSRTVGWFTAVHPVHLRLPSTDDPGAWLKAVKEQLRDIPDHGIGYGLARYLRPDTIGHLAGRAAPQLSFNYLGQRSRQGAGDGDGSSGAFRRYTRAPSIGEERAAAGVRPYLLEVDASVVDGQLRVAWTYSTDLHEGATVQRLARGFLANLEALIAHCADAAGATPSDFPLAALGQRALDRLLAGLDPREVEDVYPLSPLQTGMLYHTLYHPDGGDYFEQFAYAIDGDLDARTFVRAWQHAIDRHPTLRTSFAWDGLPRPLQVVRRRVPVRVRQLDWTGVPPGEVPERLAALLASERASGFDLEHAPPQRFDLIRTGARSHRLVWHNHHVLLDGWSVSLVLNEVFATYTAMRQHGRAADLPEPVPYRRYIEWLREQDAQAAAAYWRRALEGFAAPTPIPVVSAAPGAGGGVATTSLTLAGEVKDQLQRLAQRHRLTVGAILQGAWALLLSRDSGEPDVLFGTVVAGRSAGTPGIDRMIGLLANTLPLRVRVDPRLPVADWLRTVHTQVTELRQHEHSALVDVQRCSRVPGGQRMFDSIFVLANFAAPDRASLPGLSIALEQVHEQTGYPLVLEASLYDRVLLQLTYQRERVRAELAERLLDRYRQLLGVLAAGEGGLVRDLLAAPAAGPAAAARPADFPLAGLDQASLSRLLAGLDRRGGGAAPVSSDGSVTTDERETANGHAAQ